MSSQPAYLNNAVALLIGIGTYRAFDSTGDHDLPGSVNDVAAAARLCSALGMTPENIHVVCSESDKQSPDSIASGRIEDTSQSSIYAQIQWLSDQLKSGDKKGILWYSGHGAHTPEKGLLLCPSDTAPDLSNTIPFKELRDKIGEEAAKNLIVVLDCCHGGATTDELGRISTSLGGNPSPEGIDDDDLEIGAVVLTACAVGETSQQSLFASHWHGSFTWALLSVLDQWQKAQQGRNVRLTVSYRELIKKATVLLDALEFKGTPQIYPRSAGGLAVLQLGYDGVATVEAPDAWRPGVQVDPIGGKKFTLLLFTDADGKLCAEAIIPERTITIDAGIGTGTWAAENEYWRTVNGGTPTQLVVKAGDEGLLGTAQSAFSTIAQQATWSATGRDTNTPGLVESSNPSLFGVTITYADGKPPTVTWYKSTSGNLRFSVDDTSGSKTYTLNANSATTFGYSAS